MRFIIQEARLLENRVIRPPDVYKFIESVARTCYQSEGKITDDDSSAKLLLDKLKQRKHGAMLEHYIFILDISDADPKIKDAIYNLLNIHLIDDNYTLPYTRMKKIDNRLLVSFNTRCIHDLFSIDLDTYKILSSLMFYLGYEILFDTYKDIPTTLFQNIKILACDELTKNELKFFGWNTVRFICDRGVSHEFVRHRVMSLGQESTRYCNYSNNKFGSQLTFIIPFWYKNILPGEYKFEDGKVMKKDMFGNFSENKNLTEEEVFWLHNRSLNEEEYLTYVDKEQYNRVPQLSRNCLPTIIKTELVMTGYNTNWSKFKSLRVNKAAHPQAFELAEDAICFIEFRNHYIL